jgi:hypothetical protein
MANNAQNSLINPVLHEQHLQFQQQLIQLKQQQQLQQQLLLQHFQQQQQQLAEQHEKQLQERIRVSNSYYYLIISFDSYLSIKISLFYYWPKGVLNYLKHKIIE